jgi:D-sedoheptulose 7-phosphate isomerase
MDYISTMEQTINKIFIEHIAITEVCKSELNHKLIAVCEIITTAFKNGNKLLLFGNGGSAGDAQHIAAEFTGRFLKERNALPAIALSTDTSALTAIGNDYGFDRVFSRQVEALANKGDVLVGISTSGNSSNVLNALQEGRDRGCFIIGLSGRDGGKMNDLCAINIVVPSNVTARVQEIHILCGHIICDIVENKLF